MTGFLVALALGGRAWGAGPDSGRVAVAASTAAAVAVSSEASAGAPVEARPKAPRTRRSRVIVHKEAADWEPVSVVLQPGAGRRTAFERLVQGYPGGVYRGKTSPTKAAARAYRAKGDRWLVIALYPADLRSARTHLEARFRVQEGYLEEVKVAAVTRTRGGGDDTGDEAEDSFSLSAQGADFTERFPGSAEVELSAIDPEPGARAVNAGRVKFAEFGGQDLGFVGFSWSLTGVSGERTAAPGP